MKNNSEASIDSTAKECDAQTALPPVEEFLRAAVVARDRDGLVALLADPEVRERAVLEGCADALSEAATSGDIDCLSQLRPFAKGADIDEALNRAVFGGVACIPLLLQHASEAARYRAIWAAACESEPGALRALVAGLQYADPPEKRSGRRATALMCAAMRGRSEATDAEHAECVLILLPLSDPLARDEEGNTALMDAASSGNVEAVNLLLPLSDSRAQNDDGETALMHATLRPGYFAVEVLLEGGERDYEFFPRMDTIKALLPFSDPEQRNSAGETVLMIAAKNGRAAAMEVLLPASDARATTGDPNARGSWLGDRAAAIPQGTTVLMLAVRGPCSNNGHEHNPRCVELLLPFSDPKAVDGFGRSALALAAEYGRTESVELLLPVSDPLARDARGATPLMAAAAAGDLDSVQWLAPVGDPMAVSPGDGFTALQFAWDSARVATDDRHWACIDFLAPLSPREIAMDVYRSNPVDMPGFARFLADEEGAVLRAAMEPGGASEGSSIATPNANAATDAIQTTSPIPKPRKAARL